MLSAQLRVHSDGSNFSFHGRAISNGSPFYFMGCNRMDDYQKHYHTELFEDCLSEVLSIYCQETDQEDYTKNGDWRRDLMGLNYGKFRKKNHKMLEALSKVRLKWRHSLSRWE